MEKPYVWDCCGFNRPNMEVFGYQGGQEVFMGKVVDNCDICNYSFTLTDADGNNLFFIEAKCTQLGFFCDCPFGPCEKIVFDVYRGD